MATSASPLHEPSLAVVGAGYWGRNLVRVFAELGALAWVCDPDQAALAPLRERYPQVRFGSSLAEALADPAVVGVALATPAEAHYQGARLALESGRHVYVEKPMTLDEAEAEALIALAGEKDRRLMVGHIMRYHPAFIRLKGLVEAGELGRLNYISSHRLNLGRIRRTENILWSFAPHDISMILALAGEEPTQVLASGGSYLHRNIADVTTTHLDFPSGLKAHIFVSWLHPVKEQRLIVIGDRQMAVFDDTKPWGEKLLLYPHHITWLDHQPVTTRGEPVRVEVAEQEPLKEEAGHFLRSLAAGSRPVTDGQEGLRVLKVLKASQRSLDQGRPVGFAASRPEPAPARDYFVHPTAVVDEGAAIGAGTKIWHFSHVLKGSRLGRGCNIGQNVVLGPGVTIGDGCKIQNNVSLYQGVTLEDQVFCGPSVVFTNVFNPRAHIPRMGELRPTLVKRGATLGANSTIVCGLTIGACALVGAGAVVTRDVPDHALVMGNPARLKGWVCRCGEKLAFPPDGGAAQAACPACGQTYAKDGLKVAPVDGLGEERDPFTPAS